MLQRTTSRELTITKKCLRHSNTYPNGTAVYAVGYAPSNLLTASDDYKQLTLVSTVSAGTVDSVSLTNRNRK